MRTANDTTENRPDLSKRIIALATNEFRSKGVKAVKMDDIANALQISKRTLYEIFDNKEQLLMECVKNTSKELDDHLNGFIKSKNPNVIEIIVEFYRYQLQVISHTSSAFLEDVQKYPAVVKWIDDRRNDNLARAQQFFADGIKNGYFRSDVDYDIIGKVSEGALTYIMHDQLFKQYNIKRIFQDVTMLYIRGFCTLKGIEVLESLL